MQIQNHTFIISGGSSGLGAATASMIRQNGGNVVIADINPPREEIAGAKFIKTEVTSDADGKAAVQFALAEFGALHGLANCAGIGIADLVLRKGEPITRAEILDLNQRLANAPARLWMRLFFGGERASPCPLCGATTHTLGVVGNWQVQCYECGRVDAAALMYRHYAPEFLKKRKDCNNG